MIHKKMIIIQSQPLFEIPPAFSDDAMMKKHVLSVQSHVVHGYVGNKCATFPLQLLGYEVDAVNSVQFCCHTGYPTFTGTVLTGNDLDKLTDGLEANRLLSYSHLLTGYIGSSTFLKSVLRLLDKLGDVAYVCDPVLGDNGQLYVPKDLVDIYRRDVLPKASVATPNQFEAELLTGVQIRSEEDATRACDSLHAIGVPVVVITTLDYTRDQGFVSMMLSEKRKESTLSVQHVVQVPLLRASFTGSGDLTSALLLAWMDEHPDDLPLALEKTAATVHGVLEATTRRVQQHQQNNQVPPELDIVGSKRIIEVPPTHDEQTSRRLFQAQKTTPST